MEKTMQAAVFEGNGTVAVKQIPVPKLVSPDDVLVKVECCSICGTDVHITAIPPGYIATQGTVLGHELVGEVVAAGPEVRSVHPGDRIVCNPNEFCGTCAYCQRNMPNFCERVKAMGIDVDGGFAEYVRIAERCCFVLPPHLSSETAAFAEPLACVLNGLHKLKLQPGDSSAVIIGAGTIGLLFLMLLKASGAFPVIVSDINAKRRAFALECGADYVVDPLKQDLEKFVQTKTETGVDFVIEAVGSQFASCIPLVRKGGTILLFGVNAKSFPSFMQEQITKRELTVRGTWLANATFPAAVRLLASGIVDFRPLITHRFKLADVVKGIETLRSGDGVEILITP